MFFVYNLLAITVGQVLKLVAMFSPKIRLFVDGRKNVLNRIAAEIRPTDNVIWFHAASLGEYEQGLPVIEKIKVYFPQHKIVLTFFSPSGFEVRKNNNVADVTVYLPLDTKSNAKAFLDAVHPAIVFLIKYEYWPNYLNELKRREIPTYLISGIFRESQPFFKWYGGFHRQALNAFDHFFVQNSSSKQLLASVGKHNATVSGDTRFDRVAAILEKDNQLDFIDEFKSGSLLVVVGSSWPEDEDLLVNYINSSRTAVKFVIAPHNIKAAQIGHLKKSLRRGTVLFSEKDQQDLSQFDVFIIDTIGILTKIYSYADVAYVGGGYGNPGVHNILEPATFGVPIVIGPNYSHFAEATALVHMGGCLPVADQAELNDALNNLLSNDDIRMEKGSICATFVQMNKNATDIIMKQICATGDKRQSLVN